MSVLSQLANNGGQKTDDWAELPSGARALPDFPAGALPDDLALLVRTMAGAIQAPEGLVAAFAIGVASAAIVGRVEVQPNARSHSTTKRRSSISCAREPAASEKRRC